MWRGGTEWLASQADNTIRLCKIGTDGHRSCADAKPYPKECSKRVKAQARVIMQTQKKHPQAAWLKRLFKDTPMVTETFRHQLIPQNTKYP
jgi:hypothetical protein